MEMAGAVSGADPAEVAGVLRRELGANIVITLGERGVFFQSVDGQTSIHLPTEAREVFDVSGAGDTMTAVLSLGLVSGLGAAESLRLANKAAGGGGGKNGNVAGRTGRHPPHAPRA